MKHRITVGVVDIRTSLDLSFAQLRQLVRLAARVAELPSAEVEEQAGDESRFGFIGEIAPTHVDPLNVGFWEDEGV